MKILQESVDLCSTCGRPLTVDSECLPCLVRIAFDEPAEAATTPRASLVFGDFEVEQRPDGFHWELGHGAMGVTYLAMDKVLHRRVALKVIDVPATARSSQAMRERFLREARAAAALRHPNVAAVFQFGASPDASHCYYAMEVVEGETLEARVRRDGPLNAKSALEIAIQITRALMAAAAHGLIHRDLKPGNIMLRRGDTDTAEPEVKVIDFGLAKAIADAGGETDLTHGEFVGTPNFASPEQFGRGPVDARSDIYSLGATLWFALTGLAPHSGSTIEEIRDRQTRDDLPVEQLVARKVPEPIIKLLRCTLAVDPARRPASARELMEALESCRRKLSHGIGVYKIAALIAVVAVVAAALFAIRLNRREITSASARNVAPSASALTPLPEKSIAVLPLENLSRDPDNAYFADGIQEEVLTRLAKIADLKVISRSSTQQYQSKPGNFAEIAKQLGVANILEGSVQKAADQVRVNVHLVNAQTGSQLWAETYDRKLSDILVIESEIARRIAESLQAKLTGREEQALAAKPTNNPQAYDAYLRGLAFEARSNYSSDALFKAIDFYGLAVQLDPNFALAWARLSGAHALLYFNRGDATAARRDAAKEALENAQRLQPNSPETLLFVGYYQYWVLRDYELAKTTFEHVSKMLPGNGEVLYALGAVARREGLWDESVAYWERGLALDPRNTALLIEVAWTYAALRQFPRALKLYDEALDILPDELSLMALKASIYQAEGNLQEAAKLLVQVNAQTNSDAPFRIKLTQLRLERNHTEATRLVQARQARLDFASGIDKGIKQVGLALFERMAGDTAQAKGFAEEARNTLEPLSKDQPDNAFVPAALAVDYAILDEKSSALNEAQRAITLVPSSKDRLSGPAFEENLALVEMIIGENSPAIATLTRLLRTPYGGWLYNPAPITPALLRLDPIWDPLRADPAFQKLCEEKQLITAQLTTDLTAYELYLKGRSLWSKRGGENLRQAIGFYEQAIARDPKYALAYTGLAEAYVLLPAYTATAPQDAYPTAKAAALKALQLDEKLAEAHTALGLFLCIGDLDMAGSISEFQRAIALNPNYATAHHWYGNGPLVALGRFDEAIAEGERAIELDPLSPIINADLGQNLYVARRYDEAIAQLRKTLEIDPTFSYAHYNLGMALQRKGDVPAAIAEYTKAQQLSDDPFIPVLLASAKAQSGDKDAAVQMLAELEELSQHRFVPSYWRTLLYLSLGNRDEAIRRLEQAIADHESLTITMIKGDPKLDPLRGDPRFEALVQKVVGLEHK